MRSLVIPALFAFALTACSSSAPVSGESKEAAPAVTQEKPAVGKTPAAPAKTSAAPAAMKPMKCTYDTDCMVQNSCVNEKCKLTGNECRFRSDCPSPRGTCVNKLCQFN